MDLLECVPNVSEGRRPQVISTLEQALRSGGAELLHVDSDADHHRTVFTLAGSAGQLQSSMLALYERALETVDLRRQRGVHPRVGAVDVVPIVPLGQTPMATARELASSLGQQVAQRFALPVLLYESSASARDRRNLADLRRGGLEGLGRRLREGFLPDHGPSVLHPTAGATVIGARGFLIAFNVLLDTADVRTARRIARAVRESSGGLPSVKALGVYLESLGRAQVSMNLVDYRRSSPHRAFERVCEEAARLGVEVAGSELIGLIPRAALNDGPLEALRLLESPHERILEDCLSSAGLA